LYWPTDEDNYVGWNHKYCQPFSDPDGTICQGPITKIEVAHGGYIYGLRLYYGGKGVGNYHGLVDRSAGGVKDKEWSVPDGERITRVEVEYGPKCVNQLQFFTNKGNYSPLFGTTHGGVRDVAKDDLAGGTLRTITRQRSAPKEIHRRVLRNDTSLEQEHKYAGREEIATSRTVTFEQSQGLMYGESTRKSLSVSGNLTATLKKIGLGIGVGAEKSSEKWEQRYESTTRGQSYTTSTTREVLWSVPVRVPARKKVIAVSTVRQYNVRVPFTYTVAWYEGTENNIKKRITLPGVYEGTRVEDLDHDLVEAPLDDGP
jgi:hypothetical protein